MMTMNASDRPNATSAVVDRLASVTALSATNVTTVAAHAAINPERSAVFPMMSTLLWAGAVLGKRPALETDQAPAPPRRSGRRRVADSKADRRTTTRLSLRPPPSTDVSDDG